MMKFIFIRISILLFLIFIGCVRGWKPRVVLFDAVKMSARELDEKFPLEFSAEDTFRVVSVSFGKLSCVFKMYPGSSVKLDFAVALRDRIKVRVADVEGVVFVFVRGCVVFFADKVRAFDGVFRFLGRERFEVLTGRARLGDTELREGWGVRFGDGKVEKYLLRSPPRLVIPRDGRMRKFLFVWENVPDAKEYFFELSAEKLPFSPVLFFARTERNRIFSDFERIDAWSERFIVSIWYIDGKGRGSYVFYGKVEIAK